MLTIGSLRGRDEWPYNIDVAGLLSEGWRPTPFTQFVIKVHGRCDLACTYCYIYQGPDESWRNRTKAMTPLIADTTCDRIVEHAEAHGSDRVAVVLHGGEPLLAPPVLADRIAARLRDRLPGHAELALSIQSNGVSLTGERLDRLVGAGYRIGISMDGDAVSHDRSRRYANGGASHARVDAALRLLNARPGALAGILCTVDLRNDPIDVYDALVSYAPPVVDLLLPHGNWDNPPPGRAADATTPYADWLIQVFDRWYDDATTTTEIRLFVEILHGLLGGPSASELIGLSPCGAVVVETDGAIEQVDTLRTAYHGAAATGLSVRNDSFDACFNEPGIVARQIGELALSDTCRRCPVQRVCGAGYFPHRYRAGSGFRHPSVFCADLRRLIEHIAGRAGLPLQ